MFSCCCPRSPSPKGRNRDPSMKLFFRDDGDNVSLGENAPKQTDTPRESDATDPNRVQGSITRLSEEGSSSNLPTKEKKPKKKVVRKKTVPAIQLILLGTGSAGKSTFVRNLQHTYGRWDESYTRRKDAFPPEVRATYVNVIHHNILKNVLILIHKVGEFDWQYENPNSASAAKFIEKDGSVEQRLQIDLQCSLTPELGAAIDTIWKDPTIQKAYGRRYEFVEPHLITDSTSYFMKHIHQICQPDYIPTVEDVLHSRLPTSGSDMYRFRIENANFAIRDLGGDRSERMVAVKYIVDFIRFSKDNQMSSVIFMASLSDYNQIHPVHEGMTLLDESLQYFSVLLDQADFKDMSFIVFLNKSDIFHDKLLEYQDFHRLGDDYPRGKSATSAALLDWADNKVVGKFNQIFQSHRNKVPTIGRGGKVKYSAEMEFANVLFVRITCATDIHSMPIIFTATRVHLMNKALIKGFFS